MAANDEFPRGLPQAVSEPTNVQAVLTWPASPGIAWVLTEMSASADAIGETLNEQTTITASAGAGSLPLARIGLAVDTNQQQNDASWSGQWVGPPGAALTVQFSTGFSGAQQFLSASAYPV